MTISNAITSLRILIAPLFFIVFFLPRWVGFSEIASVVILWILFVVMEASDIADGAIARKLDQTSDTGKLLDPFADSLSRLTYFFCLTIVGFMPIWIFLVVLYRDLGVGFIRLLVLRKGFTLSARLSGKLKAWVYGIAGVAGLLVLTAGYATPSSTFFVVADSAARITFYLTGAIAVWSLVDYASVLFTRRNRTG